MYGFCVCGAVLGVSNCDSGISWEVDAWEDCFVRETSVHDSGICTVDRIIMRGIVRTVAHLGGVSGHMCARMWVSPRARNDNAFAEVAPLIST